ncbi:IMP dehydrogenase [Candidatus Woesearchaeota archaeon]|nr:IMP dehydrogenase [Candidatus Woesearchaeota archaeon]
MAEISDKISESLREYLILTGWIKCRPEKVSLEAKLGDSITLQYPYMTSRMQCVVGPEMAVAAGRNGILTCIPRSLRDIDKQRIIDANRAARLKKGNVEYLERPESVEPDKKLGEVVDLINKTGYSVIPVLDWHRGLIGFYTHNPDNPPSVPPYTPIKEVMTPLKSKADNRGIPFLHNDASKTEVKKLLISEDRRFVPIVDNNMVFQKIAFLQKYDTNFIGIAISTRNKWEEELERWGHQVDTLMIDSSNACFDDAVEILKAAKKRFPDKPFGIGNIIRGEHFVKFAKNGADYIIGGMGVGSICRTGSERGNGRGQFTVAKEFADARDDFYEKTGKYVPLVLDGSLGNVKDITVALALGDFVMMGNYFNRFYESAARKLNDDEKPVSEEALITMVETWGEGHPIARLVGMFGMNYREAIKEADPADVANVLERYGHASVSSATIEGVAGTVRYRGRLKPCVENDARYIRTTISNTGASNLKEFRELAILEKASPETMRDMYPHDIEVK